MVQRAFGNPPELGVAGDLMGVQVQPSEQGVVIQHFFEVGNQPAGVDGISMEATRQVIVDPAAGHGAKRSRDHSQRLGVAGARMHPESELQRHRLWKLGRPTEPAIGRVETRRQEAERVIEQSSARDRFAFLRYRPLRSLRGALFQQLLQLPGIPDDLLPPLVIRATD